MGAIRPLKTHIVSIDEQDLCLSMLKESGFPHHSVFREGRAQRIVAKLRRKMAKFALMVASDVPDTAARDVLGEAYEALVSVGHTAQDALARLETVKESGKKYKSVEDVLAEIYQKQRE